MLVTMSEKCFGLTPTYKPTVLITSIALAALSGLLGFGVPLFLSTLSTFSIIAISIAGVFLIASIFLILFTKYEKKPANDLLSSWSEWGTRLEVSIRLGIPGNIKAKIADKGIELTLDNGVKHLVNFEDIVPYRELAPDENTHPFIDQSPQEWLKQFNKVEVGFVNRKGSTHIDFDFSST